MPSNKNGLSEQQKTAVENFRENWKSSGGRQLSILDKCSTKDEVYECAVKNAYAPSTQRAMKSYENSNGLTDCEKKELSKARKIVAPQLVKALKKLFEKESISYDCFIKWEKEVCDNIRNTIKNEYKIKQYTYGNAQKWVNVAIKYVLSSNLFTGAEAPFMVCYIPIDQIIQKKAFQGEGNIEKVCYLSNEGEHGVKKGNMKALHSWGKCDIWNNIVDYQKRLKKATDGAGYYSPLFWEISVWVVEEDED